MSKSTVRNKMRCQYGRWIIEAPIVLPPKGLHLVHTAGCQQRGLLWIMQDYISVIFIENKLAFPVSLHVYHVSHETHLLKIDWKKKVIYTSSSEPYLLLITAVDWFDTESHAYPDHSRWHPLARNFMLDKVPRGFLLVSLPSLSDVMEWIFYIYLPQTVELITNPYPEIPPLLVRSCEYEFQIKGVNGYNHWPKSTRSYQWMVRG